MLVLARKAGEGINIGDDIKIKVVEICGDRVRLGFDCPRNIPIHRQELLELVSAE